MALLILLAMILVLVCPHSHRYICCQLCDGRPRVELWCCDPLLVYFSIYLFYMSDVLFHAHVPLSALAACAYRTAAAPIHIQAYHCSIDQDFHVFGDR